MCGRYVSVASRADLQTLYEILSPGEELPPSWKLPPLSRSTAWSNASTRARPNGRCER